MYINVNELKKMLDNEIKHLESLKANRVLFINNLIENCVAYLDIDNKYSSLNIATIFGDMYEWYGEKTADEFTEKLMYFKNKIMREYKIKMIGDLN